MKRDPVCNMEVHESNALTTEFNGDIYYFCSEGCRETFLKSHPNRSKRTAYELIIIGGGPAGLTAAVYAATMKIDTFVIMNDLGGQAYDSTKIDNYMGYDFITGPELVQKFRSQLLHSHYVDHLLSEVEKVETEDNGFIVTATDLQSYRAKALIVATGMTRRKLNLPGEEKFQRKGVFYGNIQDYTFVQGEDAAVIGGGNSALQIVENLHTVARTIYLLSDYEITADRSVVERVSRYRNLQTHENVKVLRITGENTPSGITFKRKASKQTATVPVRGVFISIGFQSNTGLFANLVDLNDRKEIVINQDCSTSRKGLFAAGDATNAFGKRIIIASGEGAKAALAARKYIIDLRERADTIEKKS